MRLDKYLKTARLIKRRTVANEACDAGRVTVNSKIARASYEVKIGDRIELFLGGRKLLLEVTDVSENKRKESASELYRIISES